MYLEAITLSQRATRKATHNYCSYLESFISAIQLPSLQEKICVEVTALQGLRLPLLLTFAVSHCTHLVLSSFTILKKTCGASVHTAFINITLAWLRALSSAQCEIASLLSSELEGTPSESHNALL